MPRRSKLTPDTQKRIIQAIELGATYQLAAQYGGIHYDTFNEWMKGKPAFSEAVKAAEGKAAVVWLAKIEQAASEGTWQAAAWKLERRYPEQYGRTAVDHKVSGGAEVRVTYVHGWRRGGDGDGADAAVALTESEADQ